MGAHSFRTRHPVTVELTVAEVVAIRDATIVVTSTERTRAAEHAIAKLKTAAAELRPRPTPELA